MVLPRGAAATYLQLGEQLLDRAVGPQPASSPAFASAMSGRQDGVPRWLENCASKLAPDTVIPGRHDARSAVLCLSATFGTADSETERVELEAEELTDRELSILRMLPGSASQREIGGALFLSINTVKAYNKSLYRKLGVASRQDAVAVARGVGLI